MLTFEEIGKLHPPAAAYLQTLYDLVLQVKPRVVFEIGSGYFAFSRAILKALEQTGGHLFTCDPKPRIVYVHPQMHFTRIHSDEYAKTWKPPINLLMIDGDHSAEQVAADFYHFRPFVTTPGYIAFHDIASTGAPGVKQLWNILKHLYTVRTEITSCQGFGVLQK